MFEELTFGQVLLLVKLLSQWVMIVKLLQQELRLVSHPLRDGQLLLVLLQHFLARCVVVGTLARDTRLYHLELSCLV